MNKIFIELFSMINPRHIIKFIFPVFFIFVVLFNFANAGSLWENINGQDNEASIQPSGAQFGGSDTPKDIRQITADIVKVFLGFIGLIFVILMIIAGFKWMNAQGDESKVEEAQKQLRMAVIGLLIILAAWGITLFAVNAIVNATGGRAV
jgi:hypothetical protein